MLLSLLFIPVFGVLAIVVNKDFGVSLRNVKLIAVTASIVNLFISLIILIFFDFSTNQFQFVQEYLETSYYDFYLGVDGLSIYFVLLTTIIIPISLLSNWRSISKDVGSYVIIILLLETFLLVVFLVLDILLFYVFFESILPPLFILIGVFGSDNRVKASFYLFLYTLLGSLFLLLSILAMSSIMSTTDFDTLFKGNFIYFTQLFLFYGIFIAFAVKTPTVFLNTWLLKAHVESPLGGSIILAAIVLKLSLYGILRLILPLLPKAYMEYTYIIYLIGAITIIYASLSTLRTLDVKELIAYSSVSHAAVYLLGEFSNSLQGIEGGINLGLAHGLVSPGLFICAGGILYDRSHTRLIAFYRGMAMVMPLFSIFFFILCLANCGAPLSLNFIGEFLSLYGVFERSSLFGVFASSSIVFSAAYTIYMYQKISFGGAYSKMLTINMPDLNKREFVLLLTLVVPTVLFGIYPAPILDGLHYSVTTLIYSFDLSLVYCNAPRDWGLYFQDSANTHIQALGLIQVGIIRNFQSSLSSISNKYLNHGILSVFKGWSQVMWNTLLNIGIFSVIHPSFSDYLRILKDKCAPGLEWALHNPPKPHAFTSLALQSSPSPRRPVTPFSDSDLETEIVSKFLSDLERLLTSGNLNHEQKRVVQSYLDNPHPLCIRDYPLTDICKPYRIGPGYALLDDIAKFKSLESKKVQGTATEDELVWLKSNEDLKTIPQYSEEVFPPMLGEEHEERVRRAVEQAEQPQQPRRPDPLTRMVKKIFRFDFLPIFAGINISIPRIFMALIKIFAPLIFAPLLSICLLLFFYLPFILDIGDMLSNALGAYTVLITTLLSVPLFLIKLFLMIRRAKKSIGLYDRLFNFVIKNYLSIVVYFIIILVSVVLVFSCGGFVLDSSYMFNSLF